MGLIVEFYAWDDSSQSPDNVSVDTIRDQGLFIESISINAVVVAETLACFENTSLARLVASEGSAAIVIPRESVDTLRSEIDILPDTETASDLIEAITRSVEEVIWREQALGVVIA